MVRFVLIPALAPALVLVLTAGLYAEAPTSEDVELAIKKECVVFQRFTQIKYEKIHDQKIRGDIAGMNRSIRTLQLEESRFLERLSWYHARGLSEPAEADEILDIRESRMKMTPEEVLVFIEGKNFEASEMPDHILKVDDPDDTEVDGKE